MPPPSSAGGSAGPYERRGGVSRPGSSGDMSAASGSGGRRGGGGGEGGGGAAAEAGTTRRPPPSPEGDYYELKEDPGGGGAGSRGSGAALLAMRGAAWGWLERPGAGVAGPGVAALRCSHCPAAALVARAHAVLESCTRLTSLTLIDNSLNSLAELEKLAVFGSQITTLTIQENGVEDLTFFRPCVSYFLPKVETLNGEPLTFKDRQRGRSIFSPLPPPRGLVAPGGGGGGAAKPSSAPQTAKGGRRKGTNDNSSSTKSTVPEITFSRSGSKFEEGQDQATRDRLLEKRKGEKAWLRIKHRAIDREETRSGFEAAWAAAAAALVGEAAAEAADPGWPAAELRRLAREPP